MAMFSKDTKMILKYLAILIIFYGAYKAMFNLREGKKGKKGKKKQGKKRQGKVKMTKKQYDKAVMRATKRIQKDNGKRKEGMVPIPGEKYVKDNLYDYNDE